MSKQEQSILEYNPGEVSLKIEEMVRRGWSVDPNRPMTLLGYMWEVWFVRDASEEQLEADAAEAAKPTRAEILAAARAAKKAKAAEAVEVEEPVSE